MRLSELLACAGIKFDGKYGDIDVTDIFINSKKVTEGSMYICLRGNRADGHFHAHEAVARGASVIVAQEKINTDIPVVYVDDTRSASAYIYSAFYGHPQNDMKIIGVTGTNGKTTTSRMIYEILRFSGKNTGLIGTTGVFLNDAPIDIRSDNECANLTTPDPSELYRIFSVMRARGAEFVVMEVSSHALWYYKVAPVRFSVGVFTNLTPEHLDLHGDMESYFLTKSRLFSQSSLAVVNCDDPYGKRLCKAYKHKVISCSAQGEGGLVSAEQVTLSPDGIEYRLSHPKVRARIRCSIPGEFTVMNTIEAAVCAHELGICTRNIQGGLLHLSGVEGRMQRVRVGSHANFSVYIDYAHTPDALKNLLRAARGFAEKKSRIVLLFGCGGDRDRYKRASMGRIASSMADLVIITSDNSRSEDPSDIISEILSGVDKESAFTVIEDRASAIEYAIKNARAGDVILLAGKGHENYEIDKDGKKYFCERELVEKFVNMYHSSEDV